MLGSDGMCFWSLFHLPIIARFYLENTASSKGLLRIISQFDKQMEDFYRFGGVLWMGMSTGEL